VGFVNLHIKQTTPGTAFRCNLQPPAEYQMRRHELPAAFAAALTLQVLNLACARSFTCAAPHEVAALFTNSFTAHALATSLCVPPGVTGWPFLAFVVQLLPVPPDSRRRVFLQLP
jgi:hypothetical protein